jgi:hypothetical protein
LESEVPFTTKIVVYDGNGKQVQERFKGGAAGKEEHELRRLALLKNRQENSP